MQQCNQNSKKADKLVFDPANSAKPVSESANGAAAATAPSTTPPEADSFSALWSPQADAASTDSTTINGTDLGKALLDEGTISPAQLTSARALQSKTPDVPLSQILIDMDISEPAVQRHVASQARMLFEQIDETSELDEQAIERLGVDFCEDHGVLPLRRAGARMVVGLASPDELILVDELRHKLGRSIKPVIICRGDIKRVVSSKKEENGADQQAFDQIISEIGEDDVEVVETEEEDLDLEQQAGESPVIRFVNALIADAAKQGASDIHLEPQEKRLQIRYRIDGVLFDAMNPPGNMQAAIISRLKIMANLDIAERRVPQDGRIRAMVQGRKLDLRVSTLPIVQGEKVVLRILDTRSIQVDLEDLGMGDQALQLWKRQIDEPHGIVLVTGPTGSGKTTTLYSSLNKMDRSTLNISTVEDPVEYHLGGINQTQVHDKIGMSFANALRALLRQDPDVIMVGEVRDTDTAKTAIQASLTGHLVLSTMHTNDAPSSVTRLINIGVEPYLIGSAVNATLAQRLVRRICDHCKEQVKPDDQMSQLLEMQGMPTEALWKGRGCDRCRHTGYAGRLGLYELLLLNDQLRDRIAANPNVTEFRRMCVEGGMATLRQDGFNKVLRGETTMDEVLRVTESAV